MQTMDMNLDILRQFLPYHSIWILKNFLILVECIIQTRSVSLYKCRDKMPEITGNKDVKPDSHYGKLLRFFKMKNKRLFVVCVIRMIIYLFCKEMKDVYLVIDRTNWELGKKSINVLCLGIILPGHKVYIPIIWTQIDKSGGNSNQQERIELLSEFLGLWEDIIDKKTILLGDREFIGEKWYEEMKLKGIDFVIRMKECDCISELTKQMNKGKKQVEKMIENSIKKTGFFRFEFEQDNSKFVIVVIRNQKPQRGDENIYLTSSMVNESSEFISESYKLRWKIEVFFKHVKMNGFNLEDMNLTDDSKIEIMVAVVSFAYILSVNEGIIEAEKKPIPIKKYKDGTKSLSISYFRKGYTELQKK